MRTRNSASWHRALRLGKESEQRFFVALESHRDSWPDWLKGVRQATVDEDQRGYDAFATLDIGVLPIQVKSSGAGLEKFQRRYSHSHAIGVVIRRESTSESIYKETLAALSWNRDIHRGRDPFTQEFDDDDAP